MLMKAKMEVRSVAPAYAGAETVKMEAVCGTDPFGPDGESEDNTYARFTPSGGVELTITNPNMLGKFATGQKFYVDFTPAE